MTENAARAELQKHFAAMPKSEREKIRHRIEHYRCKRAGDYAGKVAFLEMLDQIDQNEKNSPKP